jgi:hypothetical protein
MRRALRAGLSLLLLATTACAGSVHVFDPVDRAGRTLETAMTQKADLPQYRTLYSSFAEELDKAKANAHSDRELEVLKQYEDVRAGLRDILFIWEEKTSRNAELLPIGNALFGRVQKEYGIPVNTNEPPSIYGSEAIQIIWDATKKKLDGIDLS